MSSKGDTNKKWTSTNVYRDNYDRIFNKDKTKEEDDHEWYEGFVDGNMRDTMKKNSAQYLAGYIHGLKNPKIY